MLRDIALLQVPDDKYSDFEYKDDKTIEQLNQVIQSLGVKLEETEEYKVLGPDLITFKESLIADYRQALEEKDQPTQELIKKFLKNLEDLQLALESEEKLHKVSEALARMIATTRQDATCGSKCFQKSMVSICGLSGTIAGLAVGALGGALAMGAAMSLACIGYSCCCAMCGNGNCCTGVIFCFTENLPTTLCCMSIAGLWASLPSAFYGAVGGAYLGDKLSNDCYPKAQPNPKIKSSLESLSKFYSECQSVIFKKSSTEIEDLEKKREYICGKTLQI